MQSQRPVGFMGLGAMGMGRNLLAAGYEVIAYDTAAEPLQRLVAQRGRQAANPAAIGRSCQQVMVVKAQSRLAHPSRPMGGGTVSTGCRPRAY